MLNAIVVWIRFILLILAGEKQVALENVALRQQLANARFGDQNSPIEIDYFGSACA